MRKLWMYELSGQLDQEAPDVARLREHVAALDAPYQEVGQQENLQQLAQRWPLYSRSLQAVAVDLALAQRQEEAESQTPGANPEHPLS